MKHLTTYFAGAALALAAVSCTTTTPKEASFNVASYNLRQANSSDSLAGNGWGQREPVIADLIRFHEFDIFGTQEGFKHQLEGLKAQLPGYEYLGVGREDGKDAGEHSAIFYRTDMFDLLDSGDFWLSETPEKPGLGWDAACVRVCSWGKFRHKESGKDFLFFNLHMDHVGTVARVESAKLVMEKMKEFGDGLPVFFTGDFNVDQTHESYSTITGSGKLLDSFEEADFVYALNGTFNSYHTDDYTESRIDHIFVSPDVTVSAYGVLTDTYRTVDGDTVVASEAKDAPKEIVLQKYRARTPSDHFPIMAKVKI